MPKGKLVKDAVRSLVFSLLNKDKDLTGKELKNLVESQIQGIDYTVRTYQNLKETAEPVLNKIEVSGLDKQWSLADLEKHPMSVDAVKSILKVIKIEISQAKIKSDPTITIRQAIWISRLYPHLDKPADLFQLSKFYAEYEIYCLLTGTDIDTSIFDKALVLNNWKTIIEAWENDHAIDTLKTWSFLHPADKEFADRVAWYEGQEQQNTSDTDGE